MVICRTPCPVTSCPAFELNSTDCAYSQPFSHIQYNRTASILAPMFDIMLRRSWTMYDVRPTRPHFGLYRELETELERVIFGYDFVVLVPDPAASHDLE